MKSKLKLGTRKSLLAMAQSRQVALEVERLNPGIQVELVGIETQGDLILDVPLRKVEGKEFFVAELDRALAQNEVDFTVHSMKDLSLERPAQFFRAAIPQRANPRDVILFGPQTEKHLREGKTLKLGTSSPRRIENIPAFLSRVLPRLSDQKKAAQIELEEIRGNVNTRLGRVHEPVESPRFLDGVVLAFAGLIRLWADPTGQIELRRLFKNVRWMVLPLMECPAAPAQGALAIECRTEDLKTVEILKKLHHFPTEESVLAERRILEELGGGCHQRFGATSFVHSELGKILRIKGAQLDGRKLDELRWNRPEAGARKTAAWDGSLWKPKETEELGKIPDLKSQAVFVAHSRAVRQNPAALQGARVWTSGVSSWERLAQNGIWVEGCSESLGFETLIPTLQEAVLGLPTFSDWTVVSHENSLEEWHGLGFQTISSYRVNQNYGNDACVALASATHVFWSSGSQWGELGSKVSTSAHHSCGPGKTAARLKKAGLHPTVFPSVEEWRKWIQKLSSV